MKAEYHPERRRKPRIQGPIPAKVRGTDSLGRKFELEAALDNLSSLGLYLRLGRHVERASELSLVFQLPPGSGPDAPGMRFSVSGIVRRVESGTDRTYGLAVELRRHRQINLV